MADTTPEEIQALQSRLQHLNNILSEVFQHHVFSPDDTIITETDENGQYINFGYHKAANNDTQMFGGDMYNSINLMVSLLNHLIKFYIPVKPGEMSASYEIGNAMSAKCIIPEPPEPYYIIQNTDLVAKLKQMHIELKELDNPPPTP